MVFSPLTLWGLPHYKERMKTLIEDIEAHCTERGISETTFGNLAMKDSRFVGELRNGREMRRATITRVREYIAENTPVVTVPPADVAKEEVAA